MSQIFDYTKLEANRGIRDLTDLTDGEIKTITAFVITNELRNQMPSYLEIGVFAGTTIRFCKQFTKKTQFVGVDLFEDFDKFISTNNTHISGTFKRDDVQKFLGDRVVLIKGNSVNVLQDMMVGLPSGLPNKFNFIFIDGNHTYDATMKDFKAAQHLLAPGGQIAFHNASPHYPGDFENYVKNDGGPWLVTQDIIETKKWNMIAEVDRLRVFSCA